MVFEILVDILENDQLLQGVLLPPIFRNKLPTGAHSINIRNYHNEEFVVQVELIANRYLKLAGANWRRFVRSIQNPMTAKLYFKWLSGNTFEVKCLNKYGLEIREDDMRGDVLHSCLKQATAETFLKQELPHLFLFDLNIRNSKRDNTEVRINGPVHNSYVKVLYEYQDARDLGHASGFHGTNWNIFCSQNDIEDGQILMFTKEGNKLYELHIFNPDGIGIDVTSLSDEENEDDPEEDVVFRHVDVQPAGMDNNHRCSHFQHPHNQNLPEFFKKIEDHNLNTTMMTIPKPFVRSFELQSYKKARLHFGHLLFRIKLKIRTDPRNINDDKHVVMITNWAKLLKDTGLTKGKILRFQLNWQNCVIGEMLDFDIC